MNNEFLRHTLSTIKYRFDKSVENTTAVFGEYSLGKGSRSSLEILHHMYQVLHTTRVFISEDRFISDPPEKLTWAQEIDRFVRELIKTDRTLNVEQLTIESSKKILQGPFSDILTHIGQISMLRRLHGDPIPGEDFSAADIKTGSL